MRANQPDRCLHWPEYGCEFLGTALLCFLGLSAVTFDFGHGLPMERWLPGTSARLLVTGLLFSGSGSLIAISAIGKRSGAHLNPSVTLAFWIRRKMHRFDAIGYMLSQFSGAVFGVAALALVWRQFALSVDFGLTAPGARYSIGFAFSAEFAMTFCYLTLILYFVSHRALVRFTPLMNWIVVGILVWVEAPISGTSLNAARSFGPAIISRNGHDLWIYLLAPTLGGAVAGLCFPLIQQGKDRILTGKLFHSAGYPSVFKNVPHPDEVMRP